MLLWHCLLYTSTNSYCADELHNKNLYLTDLQVGAYYFKREEGKVVIEKMCIRDRHSGY